jgi:phosphatidate cytidylyltransferase
LTATVLGGVVVFGTLRLPFAFMTGLFALVLFGAALEWAQLAGFTARAARVSYAGLTVSLAVGCALGLRGVNASSTVILALGCGWWCLAAAWVVHYQRHEGPRVDDRLWLALCGWCALIPALVALLNLLDRGPALLLALFALVWGADVFAYFGGKTFGRRRLASRVSPGKTWEGLAAALLGTQLLAAGGASLLAPMPLLAVVALAVVTLVASVIGDLLESLLKRLRGVKDSGALLPGHGGLLDRIDSLLAAAPVFTLGLILMEQP